MYCSYQYQDCSLTNPAVLPLNFVWLLPPLQQSLATSSFSDKSNCVIVELCLIASASAAQSPVQTPFFDKIQLCCCFIAFDCFRQWSTVTSTEFIPWQIQLCYCFIVSASFRQCSTVASTKSILSQIQRSYCFIAFDYFRQSSTVTNNEFIPWQIQQVQRLSMTNVTVLFFSCVWLLLPVQYSHQYQIYYLTNSAVLLFYCVWLLPQL